MRKKSWMDPAVLSAAVWVNSIGKQRSRTNRLNKRRLSKTVKRFFEDTEQSHDGRWMWIRVKEMSDILSIRLLLAAKKKPKL